MPAIAALLCFAPAIDVEALYARIRTDYFDAKTGLYREAWSPHRPEPQVAFNWSVGIALSAHNALARLRPKYVADLVAFLGRVERYWNPAGPVPGFDVLPGPPFPNDRYYDDDAWMALALMESFAITGDARWRQLARKTVAFCLSGEDDRLGGGVWWREKERKSKNACAVGPIAAACLAVYRSTREADLLDAAKRLVAWEKENLIDPTDGLAWDSKGVDGRIGSTKWSYNTALWLRANRELADITGEATYRRNYERSRASALRKWFREDRVADELQFAHLLVENVDPDAAQTRMIEASLARIATRDSRFGKGWDDRRAADGLLQLMHQMSVLRMIAWLRARPAPKS